MTAKFAALHSNASDDIRIHAATCRVVQAPKRGFSVSHLKAETLADALVEAVPGRDDLTSSVCKSCTKGL